MDFFNRPLAITDVETTGIDAHVHEIIEIGLLVVEPTTLAVLDEYEVKVAPTNLKRASKTALQISGYNDTDWMTSVDLKDAMETYSKKTKRAIFFAHNVFFDWSFIAEAFKKTGAEDLMDYHRIDLFSIVWSKGLGLKKFSLKELCRYFGLPVEATPHRAMNGARCELEVLRKLRGL